jgi:small subunit ribosomal protein S6
LNKYEGLFILEPAAKEELLKEIVDRIQKDIEQAGGRVETVQKMGPRPLARMVAKQSAGYYVNYIFSAPPKAIAELNAKLHLATDVYRWQFTLAPAEQPERKPRRLPTESALSRE